VEMVDSRPSPSASPTSLRQKTIIYFRFLSSLLCDLDTGLVIKGLVLLCLLDELVEGLEVVVEVVGALEQGEPEQ
jgi:hypothetical protein